MTALVVMEIDRRRDPMRQLSHSVRALEKRSIEGRIAEFPYRPLDLRHPPSANVRAVITNVMRSASACASSTCRHAAGLAALLLGRPADAVRYLNQATAINPSNAAIWNDLGVARLTAAAANQPQELVDALTAIDRGQELDPTLLSLRFNRTIILERMGLRAIAAKSAREAITVDPASGWASEMRAQIFRAARPLRQAQWASAVSSLREAAESGDSSSIRVIVKSFPQMTRTSAELLFLHDWADAFVAGDEKKAAAHLRLAMSVGTSLRDGTGESLLFEAVRAITTADQEGASTLANAHRDYYAARTLYRERRVRESLPLFQRAATRFQAASSPMADVAQYYVANCLYDLNRNADALHTIDQLLASERSAHKALRAQLHWERATILSASGLLHETLAEHTRALVLFDELDERESATLVRSASSAVYALLGRRRDAWRMRIAALKALGEMGNLEGIQNTLELAARTEALNGDWEVARVLLRIATEPELRVNARVTASALFWRALAAYRLGRSADARRLIAEATASVTAIHDDVIRRRALADLTFGSAVMIRSSNSYRAVEVLTHFIDDAIAREDLFLLPEAYCERARARLALRQQREAIADYDEALKSVDLRRSGGSRDDFRDAYFRTADTALHELVDLLDRRGESLAAFDAIERRATVRRRTPAPQRFDHIVLASYFVLADRIIIFLFNSDGLRVVRVVVSRSELAQTISRFLASVRAEKDGQTAADAERLSRWLIRPLQADLTNKRRLVVIPDELLASIPFNALPTSTGSRLIQDLEVVIAPSASYAFPHHGAPTKRRMALLVGNPALDHSLLPLLPNLPEALGEVKKIAAIYGHDAIVLTGSEATPEKVDAILRRATVAHIGTHAIVVADDPSRSFLALTPDRNEASGFLSVRSIANMALQSLQVVVLAGCRTASPTAERAATTSIARAFLEAGAHTVIGTLWDVDDDDAAEFSIDFHRRLAVGMSPAAAVRAIQISMLNSRDDRMRRFRGWSAFHVYGSGD
ncbi:MAG: CHAT domain-containing protein [Acidobacteriota bacterium]